MSSTDIFPLTPDYELPEKFRSGVITQTAESGRTYQFLQKAHQRIFELGFVRRSTDDVAKMREWAARFAAEYFIFEHAVYVRDGGVYLPRRFPVEILGDWESTLVFNEAYNWRLVLQEAVGRNLETADYPDPAAGHQAVLVQENHKAQAFQKAGIWTEVLNANQSAGRALSNPNTNTTDAFTWFYAGYGFELWAEKAPDRGIGKVFLDGSELGTADQYAASPAAAAAIFAKLDVPLGRHRVELRATNTKNASSSENTIYADAVRAVI